MTNAHDRAENLEREVDAQRSRIETRLDALQDRLSPGQFIDEALRYTRSGAGADYVNNLGRSVKNNPLPVALVGVGLAWLMARPASGQRIPEHHSDARVPAVVTPDPYPVATVKTTTFKRSAHARQDDGKHRSEWLDDAGKKYHAVADEAGNRAGHFVDETGKTYRGFVDETGNRISDFRDETGKRLDDASGWASHNWTLARERAADAQRAVGEGIDHARDRAAQAGRDLQDQASQTGRDIQHQAAVAGRGLESFLREQPLVAGALAFAVGAAIGASLPHTRQEDEAFGEQSDALKDRAATEAEGLYEQGRETVKSAYGDASEKAERLYDDAKSSVSGSDNRDSTTSRL
ncbi:nutrient deprivation-induced protein [Devosia pacifica]|uniref:Nutrient deprivation-induced protein n=1 Tax=Devosia pacifica TaxID=1335967 RepID=A0A918SCU5_9HYPH|nr:DUF3618 domain-containing protein [Devosia pacifica]GHA36023.1 nutrient deprivation-induced protein [Devosia pacifica]